MGGVHVPLEVLPQCSQFDYELKDQEKGLVKK
jgi:hypothetical protein